MTISQKRVNGIIHIIITGRLDAETAPEAETFMKENVSQETIKLLFDLCDLEYLSSAGLRVILMTAKRIYEKGGEIVLCCLNEIVRDVFESSQFPMADTVAAGLEKLS